MRCTGHCCELFPLQDYAYLVENPGKIHNGKMILDMVLPVPRSDDASMFTCHHLQADGNCGVYEDRPNMCRDYPYGKLCMTPGCTNECAFRPGVHHPEAPANTTHPSTLERNR